MSGLFVEKVYLLQNVHSLASPIQSNGSNGKNDLQPHSEKGFSSRPATFKHLIYQRNRDLPNIINFSSFSTYNIVVQLHVSPSMDSPTRLFFYEKLSSNSAFRLVYSEAMGVFAQVSVPSVIDYYTILSNTPNNLAGPPDSFDRPTYEVEIRDDYDALLFRHSWAVNSLSIASSLDGSFINEPITFESLYVKVNNTENCSLDRNAANPMSSAVASEALTEGTNPFRMRRSSSTHFIPSKESAIHQSVLGTTDVESKGTANEEVCIYPESFVDVGSEQLEQAEIKSSTVLNTIASERPSHSSSNSTISVQPDSLSKNPPATYLINQVGTWLYSTRIGQLVSRGKNSIQVHEQRRKSHFAYVPIWILGIKYNLEADESNKEQTRYFWRKNNCSNIVKRKVSRDGSPAYQNVFILRKEFFECIIGLLVSWFESLKGWTVVFYKLDHIIARYSTGLTENLIVECIVVSVQNGLDADFQCILDCSMRFEENPNLAASREVASQSHFLRNKTLQTRPTFVRDFDNYPKFLSFYFEVLSFILAQEKNINPTDNGGNCLSKRPELIFCEGRNRQGHNTKDFSSMLQSNILPQPSYKDAPTSKDEKYGKVAFYGLASYWAPLVNDWVTVSVSIYRSGMAYWRTLMDKYAAIELNLKECKVSLMDENTLVFYFQHKIYPIQLRQAISLLEISVELGSHQADYEEIEHEFFFNNTSSSFNHEINNGSCADESNTIDVNVALQAPSPDPNQFIIQEFIQDFHTRFWFTYRKDIPRFGNTLLTTDLGWGCMLRCGQSLVAEAYSRLYFGRDFRLHCIGSDSEHISDYLSILSLFDDNLASTTPYSIHSLAECGASFGIPVGEQFGPTTLTRVLKTQCSRHEASPFIIVDAKNGVFRTDKLVGLCEKKPLLIMCPLRLGVERINPIYKSFVLRCLEFPQSLGIIGGKPGRSFYLVGHQGGEEIFYLDPHVLRPRISEIEQAVRTLEFHTGSVCSLRFEELDPSVLIGFIVRKSQDLQLLLKLLAEADSEVPILSFLPS